MSQYEGEHRRRWWRSDDLEFTVWLDSRERVAAFELCFGKDGARRTVNWRDGRLRQHVVDEGEDRPDRHKKSPLLLDDGSADLAALKELFQRQSVPVEGRIRALVLQELGGEGD